MAAYKRISPQPVIEGGTGDQSFTSYAVVTGGTTTTSPLQSIASVGTLGQVLTSNGAASLPTFQATATSSISITGNSGGALVGAAFTFTGGTTGLSFAGAGSTETLGGTLVVSNGGTGAATFTAHGVMLGEGTSPLSVTAVGTTGQVLTGVTGADPVWASPAASSISITGDTGGALVGAAFTFTGGTTGLSFGGSGSTETVSGTLAVKNGGTGAITLTGVLIGNGTSAVTGNAVTQHDVLVGGASNAITSVAPSATSGVPLISQGASSDPAFGTAVVAGGGTGDTSFTAYAVICGGTSSTAALQSIASVGSSGNVLTSNGAGALPTWQAAGGSITITGDSGGGLTGSSFTFTGGTTGITFAGAGTTETLGGTLAIANGGTNATSMATTDGVVYYDGTRLVTTAVGTATQVLTSNGAGMAPTFQAAGGGGLTTANVTLTSAQVKALHAAPITIVSAPGSGKVIVVLAIEVQLNYGGTNAFTNGGNTTLSLAYTNSSNIFAGSLTPSQITATSNQIFIGQPTGYNAASSTAVNAAVVVTQTSATEYAGNAAANNTININVTYVTVTA